MPGGEKKSNPIYPMPVQQTTSKMVVKKPEVEMEPLGVFNNPNGKPKVAHDDPYLDPFVDDLYLRQKEYKK